MGVRSGEHIKLRGGVYHYRRAVPQDCRKAYGAVEKTQTLNTGSKSEARKLEKEIDIQFDARIAAIRAARDPRVVAVKITQHIKPNILMKPIYGGGLGATDVIHRAGLSGSEEQSVHQIVADYGRQIGAQRDGLLELFREIGAVFSMPVDPVVLSRYGRAAVSLARNMVEGAALPSPDPGTHTLAWARERWVADGNAGHHTKGSEKQAERHWEAFLAHSELVLLGDVRRHHLIEWRDTLIGTGELADNSINQRLQLVMAILNTGWREADLLAPNLKKIKMKLGETDRKPWTRDEILKALSVLKPKSWQAWLFVIGLTTSVRLGEPVAAMVDWWKPDRGFIETPRRATKKRKFHAIPIIEMLREPFVTFIKTRPTDGYIFDCPRPSDPDEPISNFASRSPGVVGTTNSGVTPRSAPGLGAMQQYNRRFATAYAHGDVMPVPALKQRLEHFLSLPVPEIQSHVFQAESPRQVFDLFARFEVAWRQRTEEEQSLITPQAGDEVLIEFTDGFAWWLLPRGGCPVEAAAMGHCGNVPSQRPGERILSLRRRVQRGDIARWYPVATFILDRDGQLGEMKGRGNDKRKRSVKSASR